ncbi:hypothetical protein HETIRDRAFT_429746 [Heterobasidion irregulare TC 32-1]|uniref:Uncharacterized protein n=1 Tax=Heterobasidion irregulare (strain TC 32-1) TaxID=747525 RepID=W4JWW6_HETIT|nr:uncharacterized protein HETIRDRAFT_429746 [Heterobasidion irregulare TC 32-1]ETW77580.1 hypothetical protein HETIRDRAFT_429746 [Heterobasidion irregulare TC 32-1]
MAHNSYPSPDQVVERIDTVMYFAGTDSFIEWTRSMLTTTDKVVAAVILIFLTHRGSYAIRICITEVILALRSWAIWGRDRHFGIGLRVLLAAIWVAVLGLVIKFQNTLIFSLATEQGCFLTGGSTVSYIAIYTLFLASNSLALVLALAKCLKSIYEQSLDSASPYKDGKRNPSPVFALKTYSPRPGILYYIVVTGIVR